MRRPLFALLACFCVFAPRPAPAQSPPAPPSDAQAVGCGDTVQVDRHRLLRQLTLDLWGRVPSEAELRALPEGDAPETELDDAALDALVDPLIDAPEFDVFLERHHADLLFPNVNGLEFVPVQALLLPAAYGENAGDPARLFNIFVALYQRRALQAACKDEPAEFDEAGRPLFEEMPDGTRREGYVLVEPYWAPGTQVKICATEADAAARSPSGADCATANGLFSGECGCGPNVERCASYEVAQGLFAALREQMMRMVKRPIQEGRPYSEILTDTREEIDGRLAHYYRHLAPLAVDPLIGVPPTDPALLADIPYTDPTWHVFERTSGPHSGVLTSLSYLLRFQTARARANRFQNAFLCEPFQAPVEGLPSPNDACSQEPDLRFRCGCNYCHARLEPEAAHWARFAEAGTLFIDPAEFKTYEPRCAACAEHPERGCDRLCEKFYVTEIGSPKERPFAGVLKAFEWRGPDEVARLEAGPRALVDEVVEDGRFATCAVTQVFRRLYRREPTPDEVVGDLPAFARDFAADGYDFKDLVRALVKAPGYRRMAR